MKVAIEGAGFTPAEADELRRSMATFKMTGGVGKFHNKMIEGMVARGYERTFAERTFRQIEGFGSYGFPESHAASFAKIAYASAWVKCHHPDIFCAALLNAQPMGFYAPAQIVRDARAHDVEVRAVCLNASRWDCTLEDPVGVNGMFPLRLGLRMVKGLANEHAARILAARAERPFASVEEVWRRSGVPVAALERLAEADAFAALGLDRRQALWRVRGLGEKPLPLFAAIETQTSEPQVMLTPMTGGREVVEDYRSTQLSLRAHPLSFLRAALDQAGFVRCGDLPRVKDGRRIRLSGIVLIRQRPGSTNVTFLTIEDETGIANIILWKDRFEAQRPIVMGAPMIGVRGIVQREGEVIHVIGERLEDQSALLHSVGQMEFVHRTGPGDGAKNGGYDPRERIKPPVKPRDLFNPPFKHGPLARPDADAPRIKVKSRDFH